MWLRRLETTPITFISLHTQVSRVYVIGLGSINLYVCTMSGDYVIGVDVHMYYKSQEFMATDVSINLK